MVRSREDTSVSVPDPSPGTNFSPCLWRLMLLSGVLIYGSYTILVHLCEVDGTIPFSSSSMVLVVEILKIAVSLGMFALQSYRSGLYLPSLRFAVPFVIPAVCYYINNNLGVHMQLYMDPTTYQVLSNLKIATTALLYRVIIKRPVSTLQWLSLGLLSLGGVFDSFGGFEAKSEKSAAGEIHITLRGLLMICTYCVISGLAGVYTEYILKQHYKASLHLQNILLYTFGISLNFGTWVFQAAHYPNAGSFNLFKGYSAYTWIIVLTQTANGLIMSAVLKHGSNITRLFVISCAMLVTTFLSVFIFHLKLNFYFGFAFVLVLLALALYHSGWAQPKNSSH